ncbi:hypothetical protein C8R44DRAFT_739298 [Mycena epipterygia]|nr:hypothetical protein C8R44DRAFT_739298 [Mycena epipterygia]
MWHKSETWKLQSDADSEEEPARREIQTISKEAGKRYPSSTPNLLASAVLVWSEQIEVELAKQFSTLLTCGFCEADVIKIFEFSDHCFQTMASTVELPKSPSYPNLVAIERPLRGLPKLKDGMMLPYQCNDRVLAYEFRGIGVPPEDVGRAGDIFWDVTSPYILYVRGLDGWVSWNPSASSGRQALAEHPAFTDRYLWISGTGLAWLTDQGLKRKDIDITQQYALDQGPQNDLHSILEAAPSSLCLAMDSPDSRTRYEAEVARRHQHGVAVQARSAQSSASIKRKREENDDELRSKDRSWESSSASLMRDLPASMKTSLLEEQNLRRRAEQKAERFSIQFEAVTRNNLGLKVMLEDAGKRCQELNERLFQAEESARIANEKARCLEEQMTIIYQNINRVVNLPAFGEVLRGANAGNDATMQ